MDVANDDVFAALMKAGRSVIDRVKWVHPAQTSI
jgi:hypothetical protein